MHRLTGAAKACTVNGVAPSHTSLGSSVASIEILTAGESSCLLSLSPTTPATRCPPVSRSCLTSFSSSPPMGMGPTTPSTTGRGIRAPMLIPPGSLSRRANLLCWASAAHPMSHFPEGSGLMERTAPTALHSSWLRCHGPSLSNLADRPPKSWITTGFPGFLEGYSCLGFGAGFDFCTVGAVFSLLAGWGLFFPTLSWPLMAAGMLAGEVVAVSAITSSPTPVILSGVRESGLSPSELKLYNEQVSCCFTSTEVRWPIRDGDRVGRGREIERLDRGNRPKRPERPWTATRTMEVLRTVSPRYFPATCALSNCCFNCCAGQSLRQCPLHRC